MLNTEQTQQIAAAKAGMDVKTARKYAKAKRLPSEMKKERHWRTRPDWFERCGLGLYGLEALHGYSGQGWQANIFRNNNIQNSFSGDWTAKAAAANADAPGQDTGNTVNTSPSSSQGVRNLSALLALEPGICSGNR